MSSGRGFSTVGTPVLCAPLLWRCGRGADVMLVPNTLCTPSSKRVAVLRDDGDEAIGSGAERRRICRALTVKGTRCKNPLVTSTGYCPTHSRRRMDASQKKRTRKSREISFNGASGGGVTKRACSVSPQGVAGLEQVFRVVSDASQSQSQGSASASASASASGSSSTSGGIPELPAELFSERAILPEPLSLSPQGGVGFWETPQLTEEDEVELSSQLPIVGEE